MTTREPDLLVVGGGPAGLATAIAARLAGLSVTLIDASRPPIDKACGEGIMPEGVALLSRLGVAIPQEARYAFKGIRWIDGDVTAQAPLPASSGWGIRRVVLHEAMVRRAESAGVRMRWGLRVRGLADGGIATHEGVITARYIAAADGLRSRLRRESGLEGRPARTQRLGLRRHYAVAPWTDHVEVHWSDDAEAYVTPLDADQIGIAMLFSGASADFDRLLDRFSALAARLKGARATSTDRGAGPLEQKVRAVVKGRLALIGDAAGFIDAITGEGLSLAFQDAFSLAEAIVREDLSLYAAAHRRTVRFPWMMTRLLLVVERRPRLRRALIHGLAGDTGLFRRLLALHVRSLARSPGVAGQATARMR